MSIKNKVRVFLEQNKLFSEIYHVYHEQAKYFYNRKNPKIILHPQVKIEVLGNSNQIFFGYYDRSATKQSKTIYHGVDSGLSLKREADIFVNETKVSSTNAWNWQQGSMLSWLDEKTIIHNYFDDGYKAKLVNIETKDFKVIDTPIYTISPCSNYSVTVDFRRLALLRPDYGYFNADYKNLSKKSEDDGLFLVDINQNKTSLLISLEELSNFEPRDSMDGAFHKVNHPMYAPDGKSVIFLHRWYDKSNKKYSRLFRYYFSDQKLELLADYDMVSHCNFFDQETVIGFLRGPSGKDAYYLIKDGNFTEILKGTLSEDGHPSYSSDRRFILTDTYPDHTCRQKVLLYDTKLDKLHTLGEFFSPKKYKDVNRCDHHPRFDDDNNYITFDTVYSGERKIVRMDISKIINGSD